FIYADLIVIPILNIYRKYYGARMMAFLFVTMFASMSAAALVTEFVFQALHFIPRERHAKIVEAAITMNYTTVLNIIFLVVAARLGAARGEDRQRILHRRRHTSDAGERRRAVPDSRFEPAVQGRVVTQRMANVCQTEMYMARLVVTRTPYEFGRRPVRRVALDE